MKSYKRNYPYKTLADTYWPDASIGSEKYYAIDLTCSVNIEKEIITAINWFAVPEGLDVTDSFITDDSVAQVKLEARKAGIYKVTARIESLDAGVESLDIVDVYLKVV